MKIRAVYPIYPLLGIDSDHSKGIYRDFVAHFKAPRQVTIRGSDFYDGEILQIRTTTCSQGFKKKFLADFPFIQSTRYVIEFSGSFKFPGTKKYFMRDHTGVVIPNSRKELISFWRSWLPHHFDLTVQSYLCALMIAFPGAVRATQSVWFVGRNTSTFNRHYVSIIHESVEHLIENGLRPNAILEVEKTIRWFFSQNGIFDGYGDTPVARAINYFTRIFVPTFSDDELSDLVWALAGIEALLVESGRSSVGQLKEKLRAIFKSEKSLPWILKMTEQMYNYRSRMVHGDRPVRSTFRIDESEDNQKRFYEEYHSELFAVGMLVLLLQYAATHRISSFRFKTVFDPLSG